MPTFAELVALLVLAAIGVVAYVYLAYPLIIWLLSRAFGRPPVRPVVPHDQLPEVTLIVAAYNEVGEIRRRVENALATDYPPEKFNVLIASDGSTDGTDAVVREFTDERVSLIAFNSRRGKAATLNDALPMATGDVIMFSDANTRHAPDAALKLASWFVRPDVGVVCGRLVLVDPVNGKNVDGLYWKYETFIKKCEARLGGLIGSNGGLYAIRKAVFRPIPDNTIVDDLVIPLLARQETGCRIVYDKTAVATEETPATIGAEFQRRARIGAGGFQAIGLLHRLLRPRHGWLAFTFFNHKILRWTCPFLLLFALLGNVFWVMLCMPHLGSQRLLPWAALLLALQVGFYVSSVLAGLLPNKPKVFRVLRLPAMFTSMNLALALGFYRWFRGRQRAAWERTQRVTVATGTISLEDTAELADDAPAAGRGPRPDDSREEEFSGVQRT